MKINDTFFGFKLLEVRPSEELSLTMHRFVYEKNGCELIWFKREDKNKTFAISFKTLPTDSSGVFHILEHSVLCGSKKYPVKEPFVELLKGSMKTFLNAFTFPDKTMYPVSSKNAKDYQNLISVYLDAVFYPNALYKPEIFYQEGWHYEINEKDAPLEYKGVVFNEMKGAYSSADDISLEYIKKHLFPDNCYAYDSGGDPEVIKTLDYDSFKAAHAKYYHPSNAKIILDGDIDLGATLENISSVIGAFDMQYINADIPMQSPTGKSLGRYEYEIGEGEDKKDKGRAYIANATSTYLQTEKTVALNILADTLAGTNEAEFKKRILSEGLAEDINMYTVDGIQQNIFITEFKNVSDDKMDSVCQRAEEILLEISERGIDKEALIASFNSFEFRQRERDFGSYPTGIILAMGALESWLYGGDALKSLEFNATFKSLREKIDKGYFESLIREVLLSDEHKANIYLIPSGTLGQKRAQSERKALEKIKAGMSENELNELVKLNSSLIQWQSSEDSEEALATLPGLTLEDITIDIERVPTKVERTAECELISHDINTNGIIYPKLHFDVSDFDKEELLHLGAYILLFKQLGTEYNTPSALQTRIKTELGALSASFVCYNNRKKKTLRPHLVINVSALENKKESVKDILSEMLYKTVFDNDEVIKNNIKQFILGFEDSASSAGHALAMQRTLAYVSTVGAITEYVSGNEFYFFIKDVLKNYDAKGCEFKDKLKNIAKKILSTDRLTVSYTGKEDGEFLKCLAGTVKENTKMGKRYPHTSLGALNEAIVVPTQVSYASIGQNMHDFDSEFSGSMLVAKGILNYGYLWSEVRVKGGAYGGGMGFKRNGGITFYSYRDPNPAPSIEIFKRSGEFLENFAKSKQNFANFVIGAISDSDSLFTPRSAGAAETQNYFAGYTYDDMMKFLAEIRDTSEDDLVLIAALLNKSLDTAPMCVVCSKDKLEDVRNRVKNVVTLGN